MTAARFIERSWIGRGLAALRDNEEAAECMGVPTLRLKLFATTISGFLLGVAGAPFPYYVTFVEPNSAFNLDYAVNALAMPMIGGTTSWIGPVIGAVLLGSAQQLATVTISSEMNLFIVGVVLVAFVVLAPEGILGLVRRLRGRSPMTAPLLEVDGVVKRFGGFTALNRRHPSREAGERFGLIGPNGSGKTTLINCISGALAPRRRPHPLRGRRHHRAWPPTAGPGSASSRTFQIPKPFSSMTVLENLAHPSGVRGPRPARTGPRAPKPRRS